MRKSLLPALVCAGVLLSAVTPIQAAPVGQWWVGGDLWFAEPANLDTTVAFKINNQAFGGEAIGPDFDPELSGRIRGGWRDRDATRNSYSISYWWWDNDASMSEVVVQPAISDPFLGNTSSDRVESGIGLKASVLDLTVTRRLAATKRSAWYWGVGVRRATLEQDWSIDYYQPSLVAGAEESVDIGVEADGMGFSAGVGTTYSWHARWSTHVRAQVALLRGETEASYRDVGVLEDPFAPGGFLGPFVSVIERTDDRVTQQLELDARVSFNVFTGLDVYLGYWLLNWGDVIQVDRFLDDAQGGTSFSTGDLSFDGFVVGATWVIP